MFQLYESTTNPEILILCERWGLFSRAPALAPLPIFVPSAASPQQTGKAIAYMKTSIRNISNIFLNCFDCNLAAGDKELSQLKKLSQLCGPSLSTDACFQSEKSYTICFCLPFWLCLLIRIPESDVSLVLYFSVAGVITLRVINQSVVQWCLASTLPVSQDLGKKTATNFLFKKKSSESFWTPLAWRKMLIRHMFWHTELYHLGDDIKIRQGHESLIPHHCF